MNRLVPDGSLTNGRNMLPPVVATIVQVLVDTLN